MSLARQLNFDNVDADTDRESVGTAETLSYPASPIFLPPSSPPSLERSAAIIPDRLSRASSVSESSTVNSNDMATTQRSFQAIANTVKSMIPTSTYSDRVRYVREYYMNVENESSSNVADMDDSDFHVETDEGIKENIRRELVYGIYDVDTLYARFRGEEIEGSNDEMVVAVLRHPQFRELFTDAEFDKLISFLQLEQQMGGRKKKNTRGRSHKRKSRKSAGKRKTKRSTRSKRKKRSKTVKRKTNKKNRIRSSRRRR